MTMWRLRAIRISGCTLAALSVAGLVPTAAAAQATPAQEPLEIGWWSAASGIPAPRPFTADVVAAASGERGGPTIRWGGPRSTAGAGDQI